MAYFEPNLRHAKPSRFFGHPNFNLIGFCYGLRRIGIVKLKLTCICNYCSYNQTVSTPSPANPKGCTNLQLRQLMRRVAQHYDQEVGKTGLKGTQYSLLSFVDRLSPIRPLDLAQALKLESSTLTRNLKPLIAQGWIMLGAGADGRSRLLTITPAGHAKRSDAQRHWKVAQNNLNQILGLERVAALHGLIQESLQLLSPAEPEEATESTHG